MPQRTVLNTFKIGQLVPYGFKMTTRPLDKSSTRQLVPWPIGLVTDDPKAALVTLGWQTNLIKWY